MDFDDDLFDEMDDSMLGQIDQIATQSVRLSSLAIVDCTTWVKLFKFLVMYNLCHQAIMV